MIVILRIRRDSKFAHCISMSWVLGLSLDLSKSIPDGSFAIKSSRIYHFRINRDGTGIDVFLSSEE
jgi:hypothetical protein